MKENNLPPFYVGQKVVALNSYEGHPPPMTMTPYSKGDVFTVFECKQSPMLNIWHCSFVERPKDEFFDCQSFAPIESQFQSITFKEVVKIESPLISIQ